MIVKKVKTQLLAENKDLRFSQNSNILNRLKNED